MTLPIFGRRIPAKKDLHLSTNPYIYLFLKLLMKGGQEAQGTDNRIRGIQELWDKGEKVLTPVSKVCIKAIGCWDTVGALGVPSIEIKIPFYGTKLVNAVDTGHKKYHFSPDDYYYWSIMLTT